MSILDKIPFIGQKDKTRLGKNQVVYTGQGEKFDKILLTELRDLLSREIGGENFAANIRIWDEAQGLEISSDEMASYIIKLFEDGKVRLEIPQDHPKLEQTVQILEGFFDSKFHKENV